MRKLLITLIFAFLVTYNDGTTEKIKLDSCDTKGKGSYGGSDTYYYFYNFFGVGKPVTIPMSSVRKVEEI